MITSLSRIETLAAYHQADLFLFPSNIECSPLVLFESIASKTPFLTTDVGNAKEIIE
jgi:glycosyltransferase involved in cell wall biosynthesis